MKAPLKVEVDYDMDTGAEVSIIDADGRLIVEELGPEGTYPDAVALVKAFNARHETGAPTAPVRSGGR